jgi:hypothetical protein
MADGYEVGVSQPGQNVLYDKTGHKPKLVLLGGNALYDL